jgi:hypothetical protein
MAERYPNGQKLYKMVKRYTHHMAKRYTKWPKVIQNGQKIYKMAKRYTKWPKDMPNGCQLRTPNGHKIYKHFPFQGPPKCNPNRDQNICMYVPSGNNARRGHDDKDTH